MKFSEVMAYYDYKMINICKALHIARGTVLSWKEKDKIPFKLQCVLEVVSNGKLKAEKESDDE
ncbi:hypothetical protein UFOVP260_23 [uncultured Caudovirales phage]|uniref:DNA-binding transcriptional regulator Cro n=1 Tax=uncultured Caudovirales phage TaxID=2100421 RepID=A0A6J5LEI1_9CAUD|nr:hypothetical protein UFOVP85_39 [uncultured Caudovirales phage]CAB4132455.1 hypothetical protein UFOVP260_23 [uncultured Caudovirales phage]CAB4202616.1 hypothetical protein UFOVP1363_22 [uncultured Caudovirales phage]CAB5207298.1 hypothetical protein UFOVP179_56 [uncultured Caudovirales phage]